MAEIISASILRGMRSVHLATHYHGIRAAPLSGGFSNPSAMKCEDFNTPLIIVSGRLTVTVKPHPRSVFSLLVHPSSSM